VEHLLPQGEQRRLLGAQQLCLSRRLLDRTNAPSMRQRRGRGQGQREGETGKDHEQTYPAWRNLDK